ncbi:MAG: MFS transporter [Chloroflexi bacterium]|nr:MFS transporter [Chloroflexota bacterium]
MATPSVRADTAAGVAAPPGFWMLAAVCLAPFVTQLATFALSPFLPFVAADLGTTVSVLGQIPALALLTAAILGLVVGPLADRFGHRPTLLAGVLASSVGAVATAAAPSLLVLIPVALIGAGGRSVGLPVAQAVVGTLFTGAAMRRGIGMVQATGTLAPILGIPLVTAVGAAAGWRVAFLALGALGFVAAGLMLWLLPHGRHAEQSGTRLSLTVFTPLFRDPPTLWMYASTLTRNLGVWALTTYLGAFLVQTQGLSTAEVGWAFTATGVGNFLGSLATSGPLGRFSLRGLAIWSPVAIGLALGLVTMLPLSLASVIAMLVLGFMANGVGIVSQNTMLMDLSPAGRATTTSLNQTCMSLGGAIGSSVGGLLLATGGFPALGLLTLVCNVASAVCLLPARRPGVRLWF